MYFVRELAIASDVIAISIYKVKIQVGRNPFSRQKTLTKGLFYTSHQNIALEK